MATGKIERGWLGISLRDLSYNEARKLGLPAATGAMVAEVVKGAPAAEAGLRKGDVILEYNGAKVDDSGDLRNNVAITEIGKTVKLMVLRDGKRLNLNVRIGSLEEGAKIMASSVKDRLGAGFRPVTEKEAQRLGLESPMGVVVESVSSGSPLKEAGIEVDDLILGINGQMIGTMDEFVGVLAGIPPKQNITLLVLDHRTGRTGSVKIRLP